MEGSSESGQFQEIPETLFLELFISLFKEFSYRMECFNIGGNSYNQGHRNIAVRRGGGLCKKDRQYKVLIKGQLHFAFIIMLCYVSANIMDIN